MAKFFSHFPEKGSFSTVWAACEPAMSSHIDNPTLTIHHITRCCAASDVRQNTRFSYVVVLVIVRFRQQAR